MPPKKASLEELVAALSDKLDAMSESQTEHFTKLGERLDTLETKLNTVTSENTKLKKDVDNMREENIQLKNKLQNIE